MNHFKVNPITLAFFRLYINATKGLQTLRWEIEKVALGGEKKPFVSLKFCSLGSSKIIKCTGNPIN